MNFFFGASIQGHHTWGAQVEIYSKIIQIIKNNGHTVLTEHTTGSSRADTLKKLEQVIGPLPNDDYQKRVIVRNKMIEMLEREDLAGVVFEVSAPSLGTGIEIAHAYLRKRIGLKPVPILALYKKDFWPNKLSAMIMGIPLDQYPNFQLYEYEDDDGLTKILTSFLKTCYTYKAS